ncbi:LIM domain and RING finger isoform A [Chlorella sorokiniana]|uniref:LIM domain and RING finger isoform A n=1 Tax=Chlorella sorokiniana TaxID=3076 RepID=A0A2P6TRK7_CHLSO|nr:LIM domain and RING finger isoform A [Chlorella sorokiniana]|eukprot:PRW56692.1 LIM domain and RING finger isoform A [Chlorella sorokiniana]
MTQILQLTAVIVLAVLAGQAAAQIYPNVPFWNIKPALHTNGVMRYRIWLNGRSYCSDDTRGYLVAPFCKTWEAGVVTSMAVADELVAASIAKQKRSGRRLTATNEELGLVDGQTWYWCRDSKTKAWKKCDVASAIAGSAGSSGNSRGGGGGSNSGGGGGGGSHDALADKAVKQAAAMERQQSSSGPQVSAATNSDGWMYSNTGGYYRYVPRPLLNAFVEYSYGQWDLWADSNEGLNPDGSAWGVPLSIESVGRRNVCNDNFLTASRFSDNVFMGPAGSDRFVLEPVDGFAWQVRIRSRKREIEGNPKRYLGASIWCRPFPNATFQDSCLGLYDKKDRNATTTWFMSPVNPCRALGQACASTAQCCNKSLKCVASNLDGGGNVCAAVPGVATVNTVVETSYTGFNELTIQVTLNIPFNGGSAITKYEVNMTSSNSIGYFYGSSDSNVVEIKESDSEFFLLCGQTWTIQTRVTNAAGTSPWTTSNFVYTASACLDCTGAGGSCTADADCCKPMDCLTINGDQICTQTPAAPTAVGSVFPSYQSTTAVVGLTFQNIQMPGSGNYGLPIIRYWARALANGVGSAEIKKSSTTSTITFTSNEILYRSKMCIGQPITWKGLQPSTRRPAGAPDRHLGRARPAPGMTRGIAAFAVLLALLLAGHAAAQIYPYVPFWDIKPSNNVGGVMRYRIYLNGRSYCFPDTRGYLVAPFCQKYVVGRANTLAEAEQLAAAAATTPSTRRLLAAAKHNTTKKGTSKAKKDKKKDTTARPTDDELRVGAANYGGHDDWYNDDTGDWYFGNTGGYYSYVPRPLLNSWVTYDFGMWDFYPAAPLNPDGSAWGIPLDVQSVGRTNVCYDEFLSSARFSDAAFMGPAGDDRFVLENVDGFGWQLRLRSRKREIEGNPKMYLGASIWCKPFPGAEFQDGCLGFYDIKDTNATTTWFLSPVNPCRYHNQTCGNTAQCCGEPNMQCIGNFGSKICARPPGLPGLTSVTQAYDNTQPGALTFTVTLTAPADDGGAAVNKYAVWATNEVGTVVGPVNSVTTTVTLSNDTLCGHTWTLSAKAYNQVGASGTARFTDAPVVGEPCDGGCFVIGAACSSTDQCCVNNPDRTGQVQCLENICTQPPETPTVAAGPTAGTDGADRTINVTVATPITFGLPVLNYCFEAYANGDLSKNISGCNAADPTIVISSASLANAAVMCTGSDITWESMQVSVTTAAGTTYSNVIPGNVTTLACDPRTCQPILSPCTATDQCCPKTQTNTGTPQCLTDASNQLICSQPAAAPTVAEPPVGGVTDLGDVTLTIVLNDPNTFGLPITQYWWTTTAVGDAAHTLTGYSDLGPTIQFTSAETVWNPIMCTGDAITWGSMQIWVVTEAGEGLRANISTTASTPAVLQPDSIRYRLAPGSRTSSPPMWRALALLVALLGCAAGQAVNPKGVPFWNIKPSLHVGGVMRYRIWLNGRTYCNSDTYGYLTAPFCQKWEVGKSASSSAGASSASSTNSSSSSSIATATTSSRTAGKLNATAAGSGRRLLGGSSCSECNLPSPRLNTWQTQGFGQWELVTAGAKLNPDGSAWGVPLRFASVGRQPVCYAAYLTASTKNTNIYLAPAGGDRFMIEPVDGFAWQMRLKSVKREQAGSSWKYLGAAKWCKPSGFTTQNACLGFYRRDDSSVFTTWFLSPVNPCKGRGGSCNRNADCCSGRGLVCDTSSKTCVTPPGAPGLGEVTSGYDASNVLNMKVTLSFPAGFDSTTVSRFEIWLQDTGSALKLGPISSTTNIVEFSSTSYPKLCGRTWKISAKCYNGAGASPLATFSSSAPNSPHTTPVCGSTCAAQGAACTSLPCCTGTDLPLQCLDGDAGQICSRISDAPGVASTTPDASGYPATLTVELTDPNTYGLPITQYTVVAKATVGGTEYTETATSTNNQVALSSDTNPSLCQGQEVQWSLTVFVTTAAGDGQSATARGAAGSAPGLRALHRRPTHQRQQQRVAGGGGDCRAAAAAMEDICIVCAEPLAFTAFAPCGHKDACSKCVSRLRSVLKDQRCVYCQVPSDSVFVTRFMGGYTENVPPDEFDALPGRAKRGELRYLESAQAYFDDQSHFDEISRMCSYTHPRVWQDNPDAPHKVFASLPALKSYLAKQHKLQFCDICLEGRKVFISEQQVYTGRELERHMKGGDVEGPMAAAGFKGHPDCRFCRKRFYGENELFQHMHSAHEQCFLCKRGNPHKYVYYRDYADLENHFQHEHYLCPHPACLEKKFIVFPSEQELKTHTAREHGETLSKLEKKAALTLQMNFQYRRDEEGQGAHGRGGRSRGGDAAGSSSAADAVPHPLAAVLGGNRRAVVIGGAASVPSQLAQRGRGGSRGNLQEAIHASVESAQVESAMRASQQAQQAQQGAAPAAEGDQGTVLSEADFPSVGAAAGGSGAAAGTGARWAGAATGGAGGTGGLRAEDFPALPGTSKSAKRRAAKKKSMASVLGGGGEVRVLNAAAGRPPLPPSADAFPALSSAAPGAQRPASAGSSGGGGSAAASRPSSAEPPSAAEGYVQLQRDDWESVLPKASKKPLSRPPSAQEIAGPSPQLVQQQLRLAGRRQAHAEERAAADVGAPSPSHAAAAAAGAGAGAGAGGRPAGISEALRQANKILIEKIRSQLDAAQFAQFRQQSASWVRGETSSQQYHEAVAELGLVSLVPDLASTCPDGTKRAELLAVHREAFTPDGKAKGKGKWVPPEAAAVAAKLAEQNSSWQCGSSGAGSGSGAGGGGGKKKGKKSLQDFVKETKVHPQNAWRNPALRGQWAQGGGGQLAQEERALLDAYGSKKK